MAAIFENAQIIYRKKFIIFVEKRLKMLEQSEYQSFITDIKSKIRQAQYEALKAVNKELLTLYWYIDNRL
jgi:prenyltransferase beta subunit